MTDFNTQLAIDAAAVAGSGSELAAAAVYTPRGGDAVAITAARLPSRTEQDDTAEGLAHLRRCRLAVRTAEVAAPAPDDTVTLDGTVWQVEAVRTQNAALAILDLVDLTVTERSGDERRR